MTLFEQPNLSAGLDDALVSIGQSVPMFPIGILMFVFFVILIGGASSQKRKTGVSDVPFWGVLAGISTTFVALIMTMGAGMIDIVTLGVVIAITIMCGLWFFLSKVRGEN